MPIPDLCGISAIPIETFALRQPLPEIIGHLQMYIMEIYLCQWLVGTKTVTTLGERRSLTRVGNHKLKLELKQIVLESSSSLPSGNRSEIVRSIKKSR